MKQKLVWVGVPWLLGLFFATMFGNPLESTWTCSLLLAAWLLLGAVRLRFRVQMRKILCVGLSFTAAFAAVLFYTVMVYQPVMEYDGVAATFSGKVVSVSNYDNDWAAYQVKGTFADGTKATIRIRTTEVGAEYGDRLDIAGQFEAPEDQYLWNNQSYYWAKGIFLEVESDAYVVCTHTTDGTVMRWLQRYRERISHRLVALAGTDAGGMVCAMLLGDKSALSDKIRDTLSQDGISHIFSVSGLHLVLLLSVWQRFCKRAHLHRVLSFLGMCFGTVFYAMLVDTPITILRAGLMFLLSQSAPLFFRRAHTMNLLCFAGVILTITNPYLIRDSAFLLSMAGTFGAGVVAPWMTRNMKKSGFPHGILCNLVQMTSISVCVFPVTILYFSEVSLTSPLANLLLVPVASLMLLLSFLIFLTGGVGFIAKPICFVLQLLYGWLMLLANGLKHLAPLMFPTGWSLLPALAGITVLFVLLVFLSKRRPKAVAWATAASFGVLLVGQAVYRMGEQSCFLIHVLGEQNDAVVVISYQGKTDVIDLSGDADNADYVAALLEENGVRSLNSLCLTTAANQMRVTYTQALSSISTAEAVVPTDCLLLSDTTICGAVPQQADTFSLVDTAYTAEFIDGMILVTYGTLHFCIGTKLTQLPEGDWDCVIGTSWSGAAETLPEQAYWKEEAMQIRVKPNGSWTVQVLG